jgi:hypothetical protein
MTDGINLTGFGETTPAGTHGISAQQYAADAAGAFASSDVSAQGNSGLNQEGSSASLPLSGPDFSDSLIGNN